MVDISSRILTETALIIFAGLILSSCGYGNVRRGDVMEPPKVVEHVDLVRYLGTWQEIARYPNRFQKGCVASTATYAFRDDGKIKVLNECRLDRPDGPVKRAAGKAWVVDPKTGAKLKVQFFWPFSGFYWIIDLGKNYEYAVVGHPKRKYLWILSRTPEMDERVYEAVLERLVLNGYDPARLLKAGH
jgi:apolipoprotein D and lipocalin family protein